MGMLASESFAEARSGEPRTLTALLLEGIALRHQIAVLQRSGTRRPCFRCWDRLFWILFSRWWPHWRDSLIIVQPETVLRWRREGWSALWRYRSRGRWRGGRPRVSREVRELIVRMARDNFIWGAPRIHGELLMLGFEVSEATVSRYMPSRRSGPSWRAFLRNQAMAFGHREYGEEQSSADAGLRDHSCGARLQRSGAAQIATLRLGLRRGLGQPPSTLSGERTTMGYTVSLRTHTFSDAILHRIAPDGKTILHRHCLRCGRDFGQELNGADWQAIYVGALRVEPVSDSVADRWLREKCPGLLLP
jgi:hypothetical protein